jgi:hypothetical protein
LSYNELRKFGFKFSKHLWKTNLKLKRNLGGRPKIKHFFVNSIDSYFKENSTIAPNRFLKLQNKNAMFRQKTFSDAYNCYPLKDNLSFSTFYKNVPKFIKKPERLSDLCPYCYLNKVIYLNFFKLLILNFRNFIFIQGLKKKALSVASLHGCNLRTFSEIKLFFQKKLLNELKTSQNINHIRYLDQTVKRLSKIELLDYHHSIAQRQRESYKYLIENFSEETLFIELDFKMKIKFGMGPEQTSQEFYQQKSRFCLGNYHHS